MADHRALVRRFFAVVDAVAAGAQWPEHKEMWTDDFSVHLNPALGGDLVDLDAYQQTVASFAAFPDSCHAFEAQIVEGDLVASRIVWTGTHQGTFMGRAPTGRALTVPVMSMVLIRDGLMPKYGPSLTGKLFSMRSTEQSLPIDR